MNPILTKRFAGPFMALISISLISSCTQQDDPITMSKKAKLTRELIIENTGCSVFSNKLSAQNLDDAAIQKIYHDAMKAHCIYKDI